MATPILLADYRDLIALNIPFDRTVNGSDIDPFTLTTIGETCPEATYPAGDRVVIWQGDITTLATDAIVNAANAGLRGCTIPNHPCVDWAICNGAGPELIEDCQRIITAQGGPEATGDAKITRGYRLPSRYVLHTVGPIVHGDLTAEHQAGLASCYQSCLDLANEKGDIRTIAFCSISTGVFGYPKEDAAKVALSTIAQWLEHHPGVIDRVVIDVFSSQDLAIYEHAVRTWPHSS